MKKKLMASTLAAAVAFIPAVSAFAQINIEANSALQTGVSVGSDTSAEVRANAEVKASQSSRATTSKGQSTTTVQTENGVGGIVSVEANTVRGWDTEEKEAFMLTLKSALQVQTEQEFEHFAQGVLLKNENVESVEVQGSVVEVGYKQPAKFLGVFPGNINAHIRASEEGTVNVKFPWYRFLYNVPETAQRAELEQSIGAEVSTAVAQTLASQVRGSASADLTLEQRLQLKAKILETLSAFLDAQVSTE